jgi:hypothetical protein
VKLCSQCFVPARCSGPHAGVHEQARCLDALEVNFGADRRRRRPEADQVGHGSESPHEVLTPAVPVGFDVGPEVALTTLGPFDHGGGRVAERLHLGDGLFDPVTDLEEHPLVASRRSGLDGSLHGIGIGQEPGADAVGDERVRVHGTEIERLVVRVGDHVDHPVDVRASDAQAVDRAAEVADSGLQVHPSDTEVGRAGQLDQLLDLDVAEHQLGHALGQGLRCRNRERETHLVGGLMIDTSHRGTTFLTWNST